MASNLQHTIKNYLEKDHTKLVLKICAALFALFALIHLTGIFSKIENIFYDYSMHVKTSLAPAKDPPITIIAIDDKSISKSREPWPWPRNKYAKLLDNLQQVKPKAIGFDIIFSNVMEPKGDKEFENAIKDSSNVILASRYSVQSTGVVKLFFPIGELLNASKGAGIVNIERDPDGVIRNSWILYEYAGERYYSFALELFSLYIDKPLSAKNVEFTNDFINFGTYRIPFKNGKRLPINYIGKEKTFPTVSLADALDPGFIAKNKHLFQNRIVLIGATVVDLNDLFVTPVSVRHPGVEIHATLINSFLTQSFITETGTLVYLLLLLGFLVINGFVLYARRPWHGITIVLTETVALLVMSIAVLSFLNIKTTVVSPAIALWLLFIVLTVIKYINQEQEKSKIKQMFSRYVSNNIVETLLSHRDDIPLGGKLQTVTILFSDIKDFTTLSENLPAEKIVQILNKYFTVMIDVVFKNNGTLDKYIGDAIMATFGVPVPSETAALDAVRTACEMIRQLEIINEELTRDNMPPLSIRIGINTGQVVVGNIGSPKRMEFTVIGDHVNIASRLEGLNKIYESKIIMSESTYESIKDKVNARFLDEVIVKGKSKPISVYEVIEIID